MKNAWYALITILTYYSQMKNIRVVVSVVLVCSNEQGQR